MQREACRDSIDVFLYIRDVHPAIDRFAFALYHSRPRTKERATGWREGGDVSELFRANADETVLTLERSVSRRELIERVMDCAVGASLGLYSRVACGSAEQHIPLVDLSGKLAADVAARVFAHTVFGQPHGFVLASRNGLHFIGTCLLDPEGFRIFCGNTLLTSDLVDKRFIGYSLQAGCFCLRLATKTGDGAFHSPEVVSSW